MCPSTDPQRASVPRISARLAPLAIAALGVVVLTLGWLLGLAG
jgi:hypothetical protein